MSCNVMGDDHMIYEDARWAPIEPWIRAIRRRIHQHPELGLETPETRVVVETALDEWGIAHERLIRHGVKAILGPVGPTAILLRADMDALPIKEDTGLSYASAYGGKMHACGHDAHTAMLLGAARYLKLREAELRHPVVLMFQPGEEGPGGALPMIEAGVLADPPVARAAMVHVSSELPVGQVAIRAGASMASCDDFRLVVRGKGGHGSTPHRGVDAIVVSAALIQFLQTWVSRERDPLDPVVISIGTIHGGDRENVIADRVEMTGTIRTLNPATREQLRLQFGPRLRELAALYGARVEVQVDAGYPVLMADHEWTRQVGAILEEHIALGAVVERAHPVMGVEDFAYVAERVPGTNVEIGVVGDGFHSGLHSSGFVLDERALKMGAVVYAALALHAEF
ncbi:MAG: M20 family metallopeptidase [Thermaerobacter sp.]|nr:M20 family metallopeptidase [Thermaerobacter sp.]